MKIFLDTAHVQSIKKLAETGLIDGVTTNPTHLSKEGGDPVKVVKEICAILPDGHISVEVTENEPEKVYKQALEIAALGNNVFVKVPCHAQYYPIIKKLVEKEIKLNITLVFSLIQATMMAKLGVYYISPFVGRLEDIDCDGIELLPQLREMIDIYDFSSQILAASIRTVSHIHDALLAGVDAITVTSELFEKAISHPLTDKGMAIFNADWAKLGIRKFP